MRRIAGRAASRALLPAAVTAIAVLLVPASAGAYVYWVNGGCCQSTPSIGTIGRANNDGTGVKQDFINPPGNSTNLQGIWVGPSDIFWSDPAGGSVGHANIDGSGANDHYIATPYASNGVTSDGQHVFWTSYNEQEIGRANFDGSGANDSFITGVGSAPQGMSASGGYLYWTNSTNQIGQATTSGGSVNTDWLTVPTPPGGSTPNLYSVGVGGGYIYWSDTANNTIGRASLIDPSATANDSFITGVDYPQGVAADSAHIYWANYFGNTIGRANLDGTGVNQSFITGASDPVGVAVDGLGAVDSTSTTISCSPPSVTAGSPTTCTATVTDTGSSPSTPTGSVSVMSSGSGSFSNSGSCTLSGGGGSASCSVTYTPGSTPATPIRIDTITATYGGDTNHAGSSGSTQVTVTSLPTSKDQCKNGGWHAYGVFKNQGDCVSYVATQGKNPPSGS